MGGLQWTCVLQTAACADLWDGVKNAQVGARMHKSCSCMDTQRIDVPSSCQSWLARSHLHRTGAIRKHDLREAMHFCTQCALLA